MAALRLFVPLVSLVLSASAAALFTHADETASTGSANTQSNVGLLTLSATVRMPDGSPAAGAIVVLNRGGGGDVGRQRVARADKSGQVRLRGLFGRGARIHASSTYGVYQSTLMIMAVDVRSVFAAPIELTLAPAIIHDVTVLSGGRPVEGAHVAAEGFAFDVRGVTGPEGKVRLRLPASERLRELVAWHPQLGVAGARDRNGVPVQDSTELSLLAPAPHTVRVVDTLGNPVKDLELGINVRTEDSKWIVARSIKAAHVRTDNNGEAIVAWAPRDELKYVGVSIFTPHWKGDETDREKMKEGITTLHVRREMPVEGRLIMPDGASAEGILVTGFGFGPGRSGDRPIARARRDGSFSFHAPSDHGYVVGIVDRDWASDHWTGLIRATDSDEPAEIKIEVYPATPVKVRVIRGANREPVANAWIDLKHRGRVEWTDNSGKERRGNAGIGGWLRTDANGVARGGVGKGEIKLRLASGDWTEKRKIAVKSTEPVEVEFHRAWLGDRRITARMTLDGAPYMPSPTLVVRAWTERSPNKDTIHEPKIRDDGAIEVAFDAETLSLLVIDRKNQRSGFTHFGPEDSSTELVMQPTASYSGTVLDENGEPFADRVLRLSTEARIDVVEAQSTDRAGRFRFTGVAVNTPLRLVVKHQEGLPEYFLFGNKRMFEPGEIRENDVVRPRRLEPSDRKARSTLPFADRVSAVCCNASVSGMVGVVVLQGADSRNVASVTDRVLDDDEVKTIRRFLPLRVSAAQLQSEAAALAEYQWPLPTEGEIVLVALSGDQEMIDAKRISARDVDAAVVLAAAFLKQHQPPTRDALKLLAAGRQEARRSGRRVWLVHGGPRCGPCFRMGRWMADHHTALDKDYVIVKVMDGLHEHVAEVIDKLPRKQHGIPWYAITEPDGTVLTTSEGPLGNIGMPSSVEGIRHMRKMLEDTHRRMSTDDIKDLIEPLSPDR